MAVGVGILKGIGIKRVPGAALELVAEAEITLNEGIVGDCRGSRLDATGSPRKRQVSLLSEQMWDAVCARVGREIPWQERRAALLIRGIMFDKEDIGRFIYIGSVVVLQIEKETVPCERMDDVCPGLQRALEPSCYGGFCCRVLQGGPIRENDTVRLGF